MANVFDKWDKAIDTEVLQAEVKEAEENGGTGEYVEVPVGTYEIRIDKMELKPTKKGDPMFSAWFKILEGEYKGSYLFMNQVITQGFQIGIVNKFLKSLDVYEDDIEFKTYSQYNDLVMDVAEAVDEAGTEYLIEYKKSKKDFAVYTIKEIYE